MRDLTWWPALGHEGTPIRPHDVWTAWNPDPVILVVTIGVALLYVRGIRPGAPSPAARRAFSAGLAVVLIALCSPVDALAGVLLTGHMVQHMLLVLVAAPLLAYSAPGPTILRGATPGVRRAMAAARRSARPGAAPLRRLRSPVGRVVVFVASFWLWHASLLYVAAVENRWVHAVEHALFTGPAIAVWSLVVGPARIRVEPGTAILVVFVVGFQGVFLAALMTFAQSVWYEPYRTAAVGWGLEPITDQRLAGLIMWMPATFVYAVAAVVLATRWLEALARPSSA